jgi:tetratricopeptide (TPR) repeat protein
VALARADHQAAGHLAEVMVDIARRSHDPASLVVGHLALGRIMWCRGQPTAAREHLERGLRLAGEVDERNGLLPARTTLQLQLAAVLDLLGEPEAASALVGAAVEGSSDEQPFVRVAVLTGAALTAALRRDVPAARAWGAEALDLATRWTLAAGSGYAGLVHGWVEALARPSEAAVSALARHLDLMAATGVQHLLPWGLGLLAEAHLRNDRPADALRLVDDALARVDRTGERLYESELHRLRALSLLALDPARTDQAREALQRAMSVAGAQGAVLLERRAVETARAAGPAGRDARPDPPATTAGG